MFICECASYTYMCPHTYTHAYLHMAHIHVHTHPKFGLKSLAVHIALIPVALILDFLLRKPLSMIALPGMSWNNPYHTLGRFCPPLCDSGETQILCIFAIFKRWFVSLFLKPGSCLPKPSWNWRSSWVSFLNVEAMSPGYVSNVFI